MIRYADPEACPACRAPIARGADACSACHVQLSGSLAHALFATLTDADGMVAELMRLSARSTTARTAPVMAAVGAAPRLVPDLPPLPEAPEPPARRRTTGLTAASGPKILLGLGALCLLVAAVVFLAVAWSELGVGGRTGVLLALTATAAGIAALLVRKGLRGGAEAFTTVALGLLVLDLFGADSAGWFTALSEEGFVILLGTVTGAAGFAAALAVGARRVAAEGGPHPVGALTSAQVIGGTGVFVATVGTWSAAEHSPVVVLLMALTAALAVGAGKLRLTAAAVVLGMGSATWWLVLLVDGLSRIDDPTLANVWGGLAVWPLLVCAAAVTAVASVRGVAHPVRVAAAAIGVALVTLVVTVPVVDESALDIAVVALVALVASAAAVAQLRASWRWAVSVPWVVAGLVQATYVVTHGLDSLALHVEHRIWSGPFDAALRANEPVPHLADQPLVLPAAVVGVLLAAWIGASLVTTQDVRRWALPGGLAVLGSFALLPAAFQAPVFVVVGLLVVHAGLATTVATRSSDPVTRIAAALLGTGATGIALGAALVNDVLTALTTGIVVIGSLVLAFRGDRVAAALGGAVFAPAAAGCLWSILHLLDVDPSWRAVPILVVIGAWAIIGARIERELPVALTAVAATTCSLVAAGVATGDSWGAGTASGQAWLAIDLTVAGALVAVSALCNAHRRRLGWLSLGLLTLAQWVRLDQAGVTTVEAYTLPLALVLLVVGVITMRRTSISSFRGLTSGLVLALTPSLVIATAEPVSLRALLLGLGCALVVMAGSALRWSAPLVVGAVVGLALVLREVGHADVLPQWVVIGLVGLALTTVGVTWERSLAGARQAADRLRRMR